MKKLWPLPAAFFLLAWSAYAQTTVPLPTPTPPGQEVVRISTNLIQLDVTVTDKKGNPVTDLRPEEFKIYENGKIRTISHLSFVPGTRTAKRTAQEKRTASRAPILPAAPIRPEDIQRTVAILVDDFSLSWSSTFWVKQALNKYVDEQVQDGDLVALVRSSGGVGALQQFTTDKRLLKAAVRNIKFYPGLPGRWDLFGDSLTAEEAALRTFRDEYYSFGRFQSLAYVIAGMGRMPGRKSIALLSDGFPSPGACGARVFGPAVKDFDRALQNIVDYANRSSVVINTINAAGVEYPGITASDNIVGTTAAEGEKITNTIISGRSCGIRERQRPLTKLAEGTGGLGIVENDINHSIRRILDDQSYYLVAYEPDEDTFDPKSRRFNKFRVKISRPGVKVRSRSGFFSFTDEEPGKFRAASNSVLVEALQSPFETSDIFVRLNAIYITDENQKPYVKTFINVNASDLTVEKQANNTYKMSFDIVAITVDSRGRLMDERPKNYTLTLGQREFENLLVNGLVSTFLVPMPGPGGYQVRLAIRDLASNRVGSANQYVEIPDLGKKQLAISGLVLNARETAGPTPTGSGASKEGSNESKMLRDTSLRQFKAGTVLDFGYQIFNPKVGPDQKTNLRVKLRLYRDGKAVYESDPGPIAHRYQLAPQIVSSSGSLGLGRDLPAGDYLLQIDVTDIFAKSKTQVAVQFVQFDIIE